MTSSPTSMKPVGQRRTRSEWMFVRDLLNTIIIINMMMMMMMTMLVSGQGLSPAERTPAPPSGHRRSMHREGSAGGSLRSSGESFFCTAQLSEECRVRRELTLTPD